jgi:hypothetical protein
MVDLDILNKDEKFRYQLLSRLKMDCDYYLGNGNKSKNHLWAGNEKDQIETMFSLYESFSESEKPEWITIKEIKEYENKMI